MRLDYYNGYQVARLGWCLATSAVIREVVVRWKAREWTLGAGLSVEGVNVRGAQRWDGLKEWVGESHA